MKYRAIAAVPLPVGAVVKMAPEQLRRRRHLVKPAKGKGQGWCEVAAEFQFKTGEEFETEHAMSKGNTVALGPEADAVPATAEAPKAAPAAPAAPAVAAATATTPAKPAPKR